MIKANKEPFFLKPVFQERIWGGTALRDHYHYSIPSNKTGECWAISAHSNGLSTVVNGKYKGKSLKELWKEQRELFGFHESEKFPLLTKILDAADDLSVQVHPDDHYANKHENGEYGKTECWYIIDCQQDAELIFGHHASSKEELKKIIANEEWDVFLRKVKIKPGDFFYVPSGTVHALGKGTLVLETQQSSDTTYRVYDYNRTDDSGNKRELHLDKAIDVIKVPHIHSQASPTVEIQNGNVITTFVSNEFFTVAKWEIKTGGFFTQDKKFLLVSVIRGEGSLGKGTEQYRLEKGIHFILPYEFGEFNVTGEMEWIVSHI